MKKLVLILLGIFSFVSCMDRPPAQAPKPAAQPVTESPFIDLATNYFKSPEFQALLNKGVEISTADLESMLPLATEKGYPNVWFQHGINLLLKSKLALPQPIASGQQTGKMAKGSTGQLSDQARDSLAKAFKTDLKELFGIAKSEDKSGKVLLAGKIDEATIRKLWENVIGLDNVPLALEIIKEIRQDFEDADKKEPATINFMIDELVKKICTNVLTVTKYLRDKRLLDDFVKSLKAHYAYEIRAYNKMNSDSKGLQADERILVGMLTSNQYSCPIFVKEKVLDLTQPKKGFISSLKGLFTP